MSSAESTHRTSLSLSSAELEIVAQALGQHDVPADSSIVQALKAEDVQSLLDALQLNLDATRRSFGSSDTYLELRPQRELQSNEWKWPRSVTARLLMKISRHFNLLPSAIMLGNIKCEQTDEPFSQGGFSDVFVGKIDLRTVALKRIRTYVQTERNNPTKGVNDMVCREAALWRQLDNPHVLPFLGIDVHTFSPMYALVSPWMSLGSMINYLGQHPAEASVINGFLHDAVKGLEYLHSESIIHGDLRAANVFITDEHQACLADFGLARIAETMTSNYSSTIGQTSARWLAPEVIKGGKMACPSDIFAFGRVCLEAYTFKPPFSDITNDATVIVHVMQGNVPDRPSLQDCGGRVLTDHVWDLISACWSAAPTARPSASELEAPLAAIRSSSVPQSHMLKNRDDLIHEAPSVPGERQHTAEARKADVVNPKHQPSHEEVYEKLDTFFPSITLKQRQIAHDKRQAHLTSVVTRPKTEETTAMPSGVKDQNELEPVKPSSWWVRGPLIGQGSHGCVYLGMNMTSGDLMAVKQVNQATNSSGRNQGRQSVMLEALMRESETLKNLDHPNIVQYLGFEQTATMLSIFLQYNPGGGLGSLLRQYGRFEDSLIQNFSRPILNGLEYLHANNVIHRDLKSDNILVDHTGHCKIADFGISLRSDDDWPSTDTFAKSGTIFYMAPEVVKSTTRQDEKVDIWSMGCVVLEMQTARRPWTGKEATTVIYELTNDSRPPISEDDIPSELARDFCSQCFAINPRDRPSASDLLQHAYLQRVTR